MKKVLNFFCVFLLLLMTFGLVFVSSAIYDTVPKITVDTYFFQRELDYQNRITDPVAVSEFSDEELRNMLIEKYLMEYFYVIPDEQYIQMRENRQTALWLMSSSKVFNNWLQTVALEATALADAGMLRTARLISATKTPTEGDNIPYWKVEYELKTWEKPNDFLQEPNISRGTLFMQISYTKQIMKTVRTGKSVLEYLESGKDPAAAFSFGIIDIATEI